MSKCSKWEAYLSPWHQRTLRETRVEWNYDGLKITTFQLDVPYIFSITCSRITLSVCGYLSILTEVNILVLTSQRSPISLIKFHTSQGGFNVSGSDSRRKLFAKRRHRNKINIGWKKHIHWWWKERLKLLISTDTVEYWVVISKDHSTKHTWHTTQPTIAYEPEMKIINWDIVGLKCVFCS